MSSSSLNHALLKPAVLQILRGVGFHSANHDVLDAITDLTAKYLTLLASQTAMRALENHNDALPDVTDVRLAMTDCGLLSPAFTATEEAWKELLRKPLKDVPERNGLRAMEIARRDEEDTNEIKEFCAWFQGPAYQEIRRIAGLQEEAAPGDGQDTAAIVEDYLTVLKKKHSKTGEESKFRGTVLGIGLDLKPIKIDGGGPETIKDWIKAMKQQEVERLAQKSRPQVVPADDVIMSG